MTEKQVQDLIDTALGITVESSLSPELRLAALQGWLQGRRSELLGTTLARDKFPDASWIKTWGMP